MSDSLITVVAILLAAVLLIVIPLQVTSQRVDTMSKTDVDTLTSKFIDQVKVKGKITRDDYYAFQEALTSTGNTYDINMEIKILDENPGKKTTQTARDKIGENVYYSVYTSQIEDYFKDNDVYMLKEGDMASVTVRNTNLTIGQQLKNFAYKIVGNDTYTIAASKSGLVTANGSTDTVINGNDVEEAKLTYILKENDANGKVLNSSTWTNQDVYVEFSSKNNYNLALNYYWRNVIGNENAENVAYTSGFNQLESNYVVIPNRTKIFAYWKSSGLEKYSQIEKIDIKIDKEAPVINSVVASSAMENTGSVVVSATDTGGSGIAGYYYAWTEQNQTATPPTINSNGWTTESRITIGPEKNNKKCTVWVKDNAGNISKTGTSAIPTNIVPPITGVKMNGVLIQINEMPYITATLEGGENYKDIKFEIVKNGDVAQLIGENGTTARVIGKKEGTATLKCTVTNYNGTTVTADCLITVVSVAFSPNGGKYEISYTDKNDVVTLRSTVTISGDPSKIEYAWSESSTQQPNNWQGFTSGNELTTNVTKTGENYLWVRITDSYNNILTKRSDKFQVNYKVPSAEGLIEIEYSTKNWTNQVVTATAKNTIGHFSIQTSKDGTTWEDTPTQKFEENGTIYVRLWDGTKGGEVYSEQITNIDKQPPVVDSVVASSTKGNTGTITVSARDVGGSGINSYYYIWTEQNETPTPPIASMGGWRSDSTITIGADKNNKKCTVWVKDNAGNVSTTGKSAIPTNIVPQIEKVTLPGTLLKIGESKKITATLIGGTDYKDIKFEVLDNSLVSISQNGIQATLTGKNAGSTTLRCTVTNHDGAVVIGETTVTVTSISFAPNGGTYEISYVNSTDSVTISSVVTLLGNASKIEYAWSSSSAQMPGNWQRFTSGSKLSTTVTKPENNYLWIKVTDSYNNYNVYRSELFKVKYKVPTAIGNINVSYSTKNWTNQDVTVTVTSKFSDFQVQTSKDGTTWENTGTQTFTSNGTIYARLWDGSQYGDIYTANITNIDKTNIDIVKFSGAGSNTIATSATLTSTVNDKNSGLSKIVYEWGTSTSYGNEKTVVYTTMNGTATGTTGEVTKTLSLTDLTYNKTYYARITAYDVAGNSRIATTTFTTKNAVAVTSDVYYTSAQNAINSITKSGTVKMIANSTEEVEVVDGKTITLNLNSKTITGRMKNYGTLTVYGGTIDASLVQYGHAIENNGTLTVTSGTYNGYYQGLYSYKGTVTIDNGTFYGNWYDGVAIGTGKATINNGNFKGGHTGAYAYKETAELIVNNGTFGMKFANETKGTSLGAIAVGAGKLTIKDGTFTAAESKNGCWISSNTKNAKVEISGGKFSSPQGSAIYFGDGNLKITGGTFTSSNQASIFQNGGTLEMSNGTVNVGSGVGIYVSGTAKITGGTVNGSSGGAIYMPNGDLTVSGGTFKSTSSGAIYMEDGKLRVQGGTFTTTEVDAICIAKGSVRITGGTIRGYFSGVAVYGGMTTITGGSLRGDYHNGLFVSSDGSAWVNGGKYSGREWAIWATGKIWYTKTELQNSDQGNSYNGWPGVYATNLEFYQ